MACVARGVAISSTQSIRVSVSRSTYAARRATIHGMNRTALPIPSVSTLRRQSHTPSTATLPNRGLQTASALHAEAFVASIVDLDLPWWLSSDYPFIITIFGCMASSAVPLALLYLLSPSTPTSEEPPAADVPVAAAGEDDEGFSLKELRSGAMTVISLLPFFNWLVSCSDGCIETRCLSPSTSTCFCALC